MDKITIRDWRSDDAAWITDAHRIHYADSDGFDDSFVALVAQVLAEFDQSRVPGRDRAFIAERDGVPLGCVFSVAAGEGVAQLRLFLLLPDARGMGLGRKLIEACMDWGREAGYAKMVLWTHESHAAACALYEKLGWHCVASEPMQAFGADVVRQNWEISF
ncbi:GNAT family N-acetyltransferase [Pseudoprimorskyibacter insulae]|uniref:Mycothiol acetyltransferase n=1 Tax=Pseudoprimorskyibacter insulae TaxID=1695997 RepID=A0A2R8AQT0_9RHOB|nr:GNAT family N-acetyltransferase [Pseudoprimorskyibacter insulae]SPF78431.1 Mycothiol acetyltransferase [Pseudoprimorskyibacter insulae]